MIISLGHDTTNSQFACFPSALLAVSGADIVLLDLMMLYDSIDKLYRHYQDTPSVDPEALVGNLDGLRSETEEILARVGIERMIVTSERLDVNCQRAVKTVPTDVPDENLAVVERISSGFYAGEHPLRKEQVVIKKYTPHL